MAKKNPIIYLKVEIDGQVYRELQTINEMGQAIGVLVGMVERIVRQIDDEGDE